MIGIGKRLLFERPFFFEIFSITLAFVRFRILSLAFIMIGIGKAAAPWVAAFFLPTPEHVCGGVA
jgi:hypothetical protein